MNIIKKIFLGILLAVVLVLIFAAVYKKEYSSSKEIIIAKPLTTVFDYLVLLKNQDNFSVWAKMDTTMKKSYRGIDGTVGFVSAWESKKEEVGKGEQEIKKIVPNKEIDYELRFISPFTSTDNGSIKTEIVDSTHTKVIWGFDGRMNFPMNILILAMDMENMIGKDLEMGLSNLKGILENQ
jgi:hypothetical protein